MILRELCRGFYVCLCQSYNILREGKIKQTKEAKEGRKGYLAQNVKKIHEKEGKMKVVKRVEDGKKVILVQWEGKWFYLDNNLSKAMTGVYSYYEAGSRCGICERGEKVRFYKGDFKKTFSFSPVKDWWDLTPKEIAQTLVCRTEKVRAWAKSLDFQEQAEIFVPWENIPKEQGEKEDC